MTTADWIAYCLQKSGAYVDHPFGPDSTILKVEKRIFAQFFELNGQAHITVNCDAASGQFYRQMFPNIVVRGYHCPPVQQPYFNTFPQNDIPDAVIAEMIDVSYRYVVGKLPKYVQKKLNTEA
ncbi:MAG: MmcQ/YjbR family DNA-binding protein [Clostridia bacterium]|nr:MmcQ/YjbR family DNA-binding protein [Clostridia bacterium]